MKHTHQSYAWPSSLQVTIPSNVLIVKYFDPKYFHTLPSLWFTAFPMNTSLLTSKLPHTHTSRHFFHRHSNRARLDISDITPREMGCSSSVRERYCLQELHEEEEESSETLSSPVSLKFVFIPWTGGRSSAS